MPFFSPPLLCFCLEMWFHDHSSSGGFSSSMFCPSFVCLFSSADFHLDIFSSGHFSSCTFSFMRIFVSHSFGRICFVPWIFFCTFMRLLLFVCLFFIHAFFGHIFRLDISSSIHFFRQYIELFPFFIFSFFFYVVTKVCIRKRKNKKLPDEKLSGQLCATLQRSRFLPNSNDNQTKKRFLLTRIRKFLFGS